MDGFKFTSIEKGDVRPLEETEDEKNLHKRLTKYYEPLLKFIKSEFPGEFSKVEVSKRLVNDPAVITSGPWGQSAYMQKIQKAQTFAGRPDYKNKHMEINPDHALIKKLYTLIAEDKTQAKDLARMIIQLSTIASGFDLENPNEFTSSVFDLMLENSGIDRENAVSPLELPPEVKEEVETSEDDKKFDDEEDEQEQNEKDEL